MSAPARQGSARGDPANVGRCRWARQAANDDGGRPDGHRARSRSRAYPGCRRAAACQQRRGRDLASLTRSRAGRSRYHRGHLRGRDEVPTSTARSRKHAAIWLATNPAPIHPGDVAPWSERVQAELGQAALDELIELLAHGDLEQQYQAVAAARVLGAEVWADGKEPEMSWLVKLPGERRQPRIRPVQQLAG
jgi:hypothetical protein